MLFLAPTFGTQSSLNFNLHGINRRAVSPRLMPSCGTSVRRATCWLFLLFLFCSVAACSTPQPMLTEDVGAIRSGVAAAREQAKATFTSANELARNEAIERKAALPSPILRESDLSVAIPPEAAAQWDEAFGVLDDYSAALVSLVDPARAQQTSDAIGALGAALNSSEINAKIPGPLVGVFQSFGRALVQVHAEKRATRIMRHADGPFNAVVAQMATAIGAPEQDGSLANTVASQWNNSRLPTLANEYLKIPADNGQARKALLNLYAQAIDQRDQQLSDLAALQKSLIALGRAHSAAAAGKPGDALFWVGRINSWADDIRNQLKTSKGNSSGAKP